jgi:hypothetical protein
MGTDMQLVVVAVAAGAATVYAMRRLLLQFQRSDDEPGGCHGCPANRIDRAWRRRQDDAR